MSKMAQLTISIIVPVYNESANVPLLYQALQSITDPAYIYEFIFVNDGSRDDSLSVLQRLSDDDERVRVIDFSRNFGKELATTAGLHAASGDAALMLDADLQHPVELIPDFIAKWQAGADVVIGVRQAYSHESLFKKMTSWLFYKMFNAITETNSMPHATDFRLIDRVVIDEFKRFGEHNRITRGLIDWLGFRRDYIYFKSAERLNGVATYSVLKLIQLATNSFVSHSLFPLRLAGWLGIFITSLASMLMLFILIEQFSLHDPLALHISGTAIIADFNLLLIGIVLMSLGLIALYIANIHDQVVDRPLYVIRPPRQTDAVPPIEMRTPKPHTPRPTDSKK